MHLATWLTFVAAACLIAISPGSGAVLSMSHGLSYGLRRASATIFGLQAGLLLLLLVAGAGVGALLVASETAFCVVKTVGALYLIWLGFSQWRSNAAAGVDAASSAGQADAPPFRRRFLLGFLTNATNPKGILFMVAALPQFIARDAAVLPQLAILGATMCGIDLAVMHGYALAASSLQRRLRDARAATVQNRVFGAILMAVGAALFFVRRAPG